MTSDEHFTVDGTLIEAWASLKSVPKDGSDDRPEASRCGLSVIRSGISTGKSARTIRMNRALILESRLYRKGRGKERPIYYMGHVLMENRHGLVVDGVLTGASGTSERDTAVDQCWPNARHTADYGRWRQALRHQRLCCGTSHQLRATPHVAQNDTNRRSAIDARTTRHSGYDVSQRVRKRIEEIFGWGKDVGPIRKTKFRGKDRQLACCDINLIAARLPAIT